MSKRENIKTTIEPGLNAIYESGTQISVMAAQHTRDSLNRQTYFDSKLLDTVVMNLSPSVGDVQQGRALSDNKDC